MTSEPARAYVWTWLPGHTEPVVAGVLQDTGDVMNGEQVLAFRYAASYQVIERVHGAVVDHFAEACDQARVPATERALLRGREFCNEYVFRDVS
jgi:hypothetical protein